MREKIHFFLFLICLRWWMLTKFILINHSIIYVSQIIVLYIFNLYSVTCQLYLNKTGRKGNRELRNKFHIYTQMTFNKGAKTTIWGQDSLFNKCVGKLDIHMQKNETGSLLYIVYKISIQNGIKTWNYRNPRRKHRRKTWWYWSL